MNDCVWNWYTICDKTCECYGCKEYLSANSTKGKLISEEIESEFEKVREIWRCRRINGR